MSFNRPESPMPHDPLFSRYGTEHSFSQTRVITEGFWGPTPWYFEVGGSHPQEELCTAAFGVITHQRKIALVEHITRGFELPGGHKNPTETPIQAMRREVREESGGVVNTATYFGHKRVVGKSVPHRDNPGEFYPAESYVPYYCGEADEVLDVPPTEDVKSIAWVTWEEAQKMLAPGHNHDKIIQYAINQGLIDL